MLEPLRNGVLFVFLDEVADGQFNETTNWGFVVGRNHELSAQRGRWARVLATGPDVRKEDVDVGQYIFIEPLMWTPGFTYDEYQIWKTDTNKILLVSDEMPNRDCL